MTAPTEYVYESPDGGHTVYRRPIGGPIDIRELYSISHEQKLRELRCQRENRWIEILMASESDPELQRMLEKIEIYHDLKKQP